MFENSRSNIILSHLFHLTGYFHDPQTKGKIPYINIYSKPKDDIYEPIPANGEGISCVDDVSRAVILSLEIFEFFKNTEAKQYALELLKFIDYMTDEDGRVINFLYSNKGDKKVGIRSSYKGGGWWSSRAKWALAKAYKLTSNIQYLNLYRKIKITKKYKNDIAAILLLAELELGGEASNGLILKYISRITSSVKDGYFKHVPNEKNTHMWGYHELEAIAKASKKFQDNNLLSLCFSAVNSLVKDAVENKYYYDFPKRNQEGLCAYCVSPFIRGLYEIHSITHDTTVLDLMKSSINWFYGDNLYNTALYDNKTGRCLDGIHSGKMSNNAGAESSIEAGFCEIRRLLIS